MHHQSTTPERHLADLLMETGLDRTQVATITELPYPMVCGCDDVLNGYRHTAGPRSPLTAANHAEYVAGQRLADAWLLGDDASWGPAAGDDPRSAAEIFAAARRPLTAREIEAAADADPFARLG